jgi:hypothetical protein
MVAGMKPNLNANDVHAYIVGHFGASPGSFTVHPHHLRDFLVLFQDVSLMLQVLNDPIPLGSVKIAFKRWRRENWAEEVSLDYRLKVAMIGIPAHLWLVSTVEEILGSSCSIVSIAQETESKANLKQFLVMVDCLHPDLVPTTKVMVAPTTSGQPGSLPCLRYRAVVDILEVVELPPDAAPGAPGRRFLRRLGRQVGLTRVEGALTKGLRLRRSGCRLPVGLVV